MWPLYVASKAPEIQQSQQQWVKNTLLGLGQIGRIPKAAMLVRIECLPPVSLVEADIVYLGSN